jgi:hypothetical protein
LTGSMTKNTTALLTATGTRQASSKSCGVITSTLSMMVVVVGVGLVANQWVNIRKSNSKLLIHLLVVVVSEVELVVVVTVEVVTAAVVTTIPVVVRFAIGVVVPRGCQWQS